MYLFLSAFHLDCARSSDGRRKKESRKSQVKKKTQTHRVHYIIIMNAFSGNRFQLY